MDLIRNDANSTKSTNNIYRQLKNEKRRSRYKNNTNNVSGLQHLSEFFLKNVHVLFPFHSPLVVVIL